MGRAIGKPRGIAVDDGRCYHGFRNRHDSRGRVLEAHVRPFRRDCQPDKYAGAHRPGHRPQG
eukprot:6008564-Pyramimonas_sp.AAC.1